MLVALATPSTGVVKVGLVASTAFPLPVVPAATGCPLEFVPSTVALAGIDPPLTCLALALPSCPSSCQYVPSNVALIQCPANTSFAASVLLLPHFMIVAAAAPFIASVADPVFAALNSMEIVSPAAGVKLGEVVQL